MNSRFTKFSKLSTKEYVSRFEYLVKTERHTTNEIIEMIIEGLRRRIYLELGFSSMFDWLCRHFGYTKAAAQRRIDAARLIYSMPERKGDVAEKIESGVLTLSNLSKVQSAIRAQELESGEKVSKDLKLQIVQEIENKTILEAEQLLCKHLPAVVSSVHQERKQVINENVVRYSMNFKKETTDNLKRAKDLLSHKFPNGSDADVIGYALNFLLEKTDPLRKIEKRKKEIPAPQKNVKAAIQSGKDMEGLETIEGSAATRFDQTQNIDNKASEDRSGTKCYGDSAVQNSVSRSDYRQTLKNSLGRCSFTSSVTGHRCESTYQVQVDHFVPRAVGGSNRPENLRALCREHNIFEAEKVFGAAKMVQFRREGV